MSDYTKLTDFASKDNLPPGSAGKIVKGAEIDDEFEAIETAVNTKADKASPTFTGTPVAPTATSGTNTTQIATTAFVTGAVSDANANTALSGTPTAPTAATGTNTTQVATTAFVHAQIDADLATDKASPAFTGTPTAPTAASGTDTTQIATTAFVQDAVTGNANLDSPAFTGTPTAPTPAAGDDSTKIATTAFVADAVTDNSYSLGDGDVTTVKIADLAVTTAKIAANAITSAKIANDAVGGDQIATGAVTADSIAENAVTSSELANSSVDSSHLSDDAVTGAKIAAGAVAANELADGGVTSAKLADDAVTTAKIANNAVTDDQLGLASVGANQLKSNAVTSAKISATAVTNSKLAADAVTNSKLADNAVQLENINNTADGGTNSVLVKDTSPTGLSFAKVGTAMMEDDSVTALKLSPDTTGFSTANYTDVLCYAPVTGGLAFTQNIPSYKLSGITNNDSGTAGQVMKSTGSNGQLEWADEGGVPSAAGGGTWSRSGNSYSNDTVCSVPDGGKFVGFNAGGTSGGPYFVYGTSNTTTGITNDSGGVWTNNTGSAQTVYLRARGGSSSDDSSSGTYFGFSTN